MAIVREVSGGTISYIVDSPSDADMHTIWLFLHSHQGTDEETDEDSTPEADGESDGEWIDAIERLKQDLPGSELVLPENSGLIKTVINEDTYTLAIRQ
jgi:hypothetical protein